MGCGSSVPGAELGREKRGGAETWFRRWAGFIDRGLDPVRETQDAIRGYVQDIVAVAATWDPAHGACARRPIEFGTLQEQFRRSRDPVRVQMATVMARFQPGLFVGWCLALAFDAS